MGSLRYWRDGAWFPSDTPAFFSNGSIAVGRACFTTAKVQNGRIIFLQQHLQRLERDARTLGLPAAENEYLRQSLVDVAQECFPENIGIVRATLTANASAPTSLVIQPRDWQSPSNSWKSIIAPFPHPGIQPWAGAKVVNRLFYEQAMHEAHKAQAEEALLFDRKGHLVEGTHTNFFAMDEDERIVTPPLRRGAVAGIARELLLQHMPEIEERDISQAEIFDFKALVATNAVRGAISIRQIGTQRLAENRERNLAQEFNQQFDIIASDEASGEKL